MGRVWQEVVVAYCNVLGCWHLSRAVVLNIYCGLHPSGSPFVLESLPEIVNGHEFFKPSIQPNYSMEKI